MNSELLDLLQEDIYTDAHEYAGRVERVKELVAEEVAYFTERLGLDA